MEVAQSTMQAVARDMNLSNVDIPSVAVVVPCYNEHGAVPNLITALAALHEILASTYEIEFVLVDDGSVDDTHRTLKAAFDHLPNYTVISHETNRGIAAAIMTGFRHTTAEIVCSMDSDCTYDPKKLIDMIPLLTEDGADVVTASPYHPQGKVHDASGQIAGGWRIWLSRSASCIYQRLFRQKLYCYTCCFRVYRRSALANITLSSPGFVGITELLWKLDQKRARIVEVPAVLTPRRFGVSKMRVMRNIVGHGRLILRVMVARFGDILGLKTSSTADVAAHGARREISTLSEEANGLSIAYSKKDITT